MLKIRNKYFTSIIVTIITGIILTSFYIYTMILDRKLIKLENKIKSNFKKRLDFIPVLYDLTKGKIKMHSKMFEKILDYRNIGIFNYKEMTFSEIIKNEINIHKELIFLFKVINKLDSLKTERDYKYVENFFNKNSKEIGKDIATYKVYSKVLNKLITVKNFTILGLLIPVKPKKLI